MTTYRAAAVLRPGLFLLSQYLLLPHPLYPPSTSPVPATQLANASKAKKRLLRLGRSESPGIHCGTFCKGAEYADIQRAHAPASRDTDLAATIISLEPSMVLRFSHL